MITKEYAATLIARAETRIAAALARLPLKHLNKCVLNKLDDEASKSIKAKQDNRGQAKKMLHLFRTNDTRATRNICFSVQHRWLSTNVRLEQY